MEKKLENKNEGEKLPAIEQLREPIKKILEDIKHVINRGEYDVVLGDDASGRIPALIIYNVIKNIYTKNKMDPPLARFVAGSGSPSGRGNKVLEQAIGKKESWAIRKDTNLAEYTKELHELLNQKGSAGTQKRVLVVTDAIGTGMSLQPLCRALQNAGLEFDLVALSKPEGEFLKRAEKRLGVNIVGGGMPGVQKPYYEQNLSGVVKNAENLHATTLPNSNTERARARKDASLLSEELAYWYEKNNKT